MRRIESKKAIAIKATSKHLVIVLPDREVRIPWERCSPALASANDSERRNAELSPGGYGIHWPDIDEDLSANGLLRDQEAASLT